MKRIYESFGEIAEDFKDGESWTHRISDHTEDECFGWQHGIIEFAKWLDECKVKIIENTEIYNKLWDYFHYDKFKPNKYKKCTSLKTIYEKYCKGKRQKGIPKEIHNFIKSLYE